MRWHVQSRSWLVLIHRSIQTVQHGQVGSREEQRSPSSRSSVRSIVRQSADQTTRGHGDVTWDISDCFNHSHDDGRSRLDLVVLTTTKQLSLERERPPRVRRSKPNSEGTCAELGRVLRRSSTALHGYVGVLLMSSVPQFTDPFIVSSAPDSMVTQRSSHRVHSQEPLEIHGSVCPRCLRADVGGFRFVVHCDRCEAPLLDRSVAPECFRFSDASHGQIHVSSSYHVQRSSLCVFGAAPGNRSLQTKGSWMPHAACPRCKRASPLHRSSRFENRASWPDHRSVSCVAQWLSVNTLRTCGRFSTRNVHTR